MTSKNSKNLYSQNQKENINSFKAYLEDMGEKIDFIFSKLSYELPEKEKIKKFYLKQYSILLKNGDLDTNHDLARYTQNNHFEVLMNKQPEYISALPLINFRQYQDYRIVSTLENKDRIVILKKKPYNYFEIILTPLTQSKIKTILSYRNPSTPIIKNNENI